MKEPKERFVMCPCCICGVKVLIPESMINERVLCDACYFDEGESEYEN